MIASSLLWVVSLLKLMGGCTRDCGNHSFNSYMPSHVHACVAMYRCPTLYIETQGDSHMLSVEAFSYDWDQKWNQVIN